MNAAHSRAGLQQLLRILPDWEKVCGSGAVPVLSAKEKCRSAALGFHLYGCSDGDCGHRAIQYHSCRNRHCPHCGGMKKDEWIEARMKELLPCKYFHVVFTVPHELNGLFMKNRKEMFKLLFDASAETLQTFSRDEKFLGADPGIISVLHT